jgi:4-diphosphocytidyl-2-C-methyl-D-erythritol kinase
MKAAMGLAQAAGVDHGAALYLEKRVPYGAGLGGGSSDAATVLRLLDRHWGLAYPDARLREIAATLGADVPFFLGPPAAYGTGRGDRLDPLHAPDGSPYAFPFTLVVVVPPVAVSTADAYRRVRPDADHRPDLRALVASNDLARWRQHLVNDFEPSVCAAYPVIFDAKSRLLDAGAGYAALSGSGSAVIGVFEEAALAEAAAKSARQAGFFVWDRKQNEGPSV